MDMTFLESIGKFAAGGGAAALIFKLFSRGYENRIEQENRLLDHVQALNDKLIEKFMYGNGRDTGGLAQIEEKIVSMNAKLDEHGVILRDLPCQKERACNQIPPQPQRQASVGDDRWVPHS